ncbi:ABC transporter permease [Miniphocaeibacter halophilus]|uniref:ABC transporter permease n=1 Tax=Miniphocaeibacter halophilus TaxID=2931922 RepID=A0AC61MQI4_9FIRM|nr:ABC transporter permease [Miniphocaeibacter halophilus]QQK07867.1 ABC transporter permease [Miniphocaeibacter halophilus]
MKLLNNFYANIKRLIKSPKIWFIFVIMPAFMYLLYFFMFNNSGVSYNTLGVVIEDKGNQYEELLEVFGENPNIIKNRQEATKLLENYDVSIVYLIGENFSEDLKNNKFPKVEKLFVDDSGVQIEDKLINDKISELLEKNYLKNNNIDTDSLNIETEVNVETINNKTGVDGYAMIILILCCFFIISFIGQIGQDIINISKTKVLSRILISPNRSFMNIFVIFLSYLTLVGTIFSIMTTIGFKVLQTENIELFKLTLMIFSISAYSLSFIILITRIAKKEIVLSMVPLVVGIIFFITSTFYLNNVNIPNWAEYAFYLNPLYWIIVTVETNNLINLIPIVLMTLVLLTFGSNKLEKLQNI